MIQDKQEIFGMLRNQKDKIRSLGVKRLGLFGSFARGEQNQNSDIDVLVEFEKGQKTFDHFIHLAFFLEELFKRRVEVVTPESLSPYLKPRITSGIEYVSFGS
jgi:predicted nucleotidyltransferase